MNKVLFDTYAPDAAAKSAIDSQLNWSGQLPALNLAVAASAVFNHAAYNPYRRSWVATGASKVVRESFSAGQVFQANAVSGLGGAANALQVGVKDSDGTMVVTTDADEIYEHNGISTWTRRTVVFGVAADAGEVYRVGYDPINALWLAGSCGGSVGVFYSSPDRVTWTGVSVPSGGANQAPLMAIDKANGRVCFAKRRGASGTEFLASDDGGTTWVTATYALLAHGFTANYKQSLTFEEVSGLFIFTIGNSSTPASKVYTSPDGLTWTLKVSLAAACIFRIATIGELWLAQVGSFAFAVSTDRGVTWRRTDFEPDNTVAALEGSTACNQFLAFTTSTVYASPRYGQGGAVLT